MPYIAEGLFTHSLVMGALLGVVLWTLYRYDLCHWLSFGFWSWAAFALYFLITPLIQFYGDPYYLESRLAVTEGLPRMLWVTCCLAAGISVYFWAYFRTVPSRLNLGLSKEEWPPGTWLVLILALAGGTYSLIYFRGAFGLEMIPREIVQGKYKGEVMGYQAVMHYFATFPIILLLLRRSTRVLGLVLAGVFLLARLEDAWDRFSAVSLLLALTMVFTLLKNRRWPHVALLASIVLFTLLMHARGHLPISKFRASGKMTVETSKKEVQRGEGASMLATLYLKTYLHDRGGYNYGVPFISQLIFGPLPRKYFPWKDWLMEEFSPDVDYLHIPGSKMLYGAKHSVIGDLYGFGNIVAITAGMWFLGFFCRKLDGFLSPQRPQAVNAIGICWLSSLWLMLGSSLAWFSCALYLNAIPFIGMVICAKFQEGPIFFSSPRKLKLSNKIGKSRSD